MNKKVKPALKIIPMTITGAKKFIKLYHRHLPNSPASALFAVGLEYNKLIAGVALVARPVAINLDDGYTAEISRCCVMNDAPLGSCSKLYAACRKTAAAMGYRKVTTYTLQKESGSSLRGAGFLQAELLKPRGGWTNRPGRRRNGTEYTGKIRWEFDLGHVSNPGDAGETGNNIVPFKLQPVFRTYYGGKGGSGTYQQIINEIRPHSRLIVPFLGNCAVIRHIRPAGEIIGIDKSADVISRWKNRGITLHHGCGIGYLESLAGRNLAGTVIYCDPPYPVSSRKTRRGRYAHELSDEDHERLLKAVKSLACDVLISTYKNPLYERVLSSWRLKTFHSTTRRGRAVEYLYMNYENPGCVLHDYSYLGDNFRERERIKRKIKRWVDNLRQLPGFERNAIVQAIMEADLAGDSQAVSMEPAVLQDR